MDETTWRRVVGWYLVVWIVVLIGVLIDRWPAEPGIAGAADPNAARRVEPGALTVTVASRSADNVPVGQTYLVRSKSDSRLVLEPIPYPISGVAFLVLVLATGALGACLHGISSLALWVGKKKFSKDWGLWYLFRPFAGALLALVFYLIIRGGFLPQVSVSSAGFYGIIGLSGLIGLFSKQALKKLSNVFDVIFASEKPDEDRLEDQLREVGPNPVPEIKPIEPGGPIAAGQPCAEIVVKGKNFVRGCMVKVGQAGLETEYIGDTELRATLRKEDLENPGTLDIAVFNPRPGGGLSNVEKVTVEGPKKQASK